MEKYSTPPHPRPASPPGSPLRNHLNTPSRCLSAPASFFHTVSPLIFLAPVFLVFEVAQLVLGERYLGIKQIARNADPRALRLSEVTAFFWTVAIFSYWFWMLGLLFTPLGRADALGLLIVSSAGFSIRRGTPLKWTLVTLTLEGAVRIGFLLSLCGLIWRTW